MGVAQQDSRRGLSYLQVHAQMPTRHELRHDTHHLRKARGGGAHVKALQAHLPGACAPCVEGGLAQRVELTAVGQAGKPAPVLWGGERLQDGEHEALVGEQVGACGHLAEVGRLARIHGLAPRLAVRGEAA